MTRHSKNRTASPHFSHAERSGIDSGTKRARIGSEAFRRFDACALCLNPARDPRVCSKGHLFCNECIIGNLVKQKQDIKRQQALVDKMRLEEAADREAALEKARERVLEDFEKAQKGGSRAGGSSNSIIKAPVAVAGAKRKFVESEEMDSMLRSAEEAALKQLEEEQRLSRASKLSSNYWLASNTPEAAPTRLDDVKLQTLCQASGKPHPLALKSLSEVKFDIDPVKNTTDEQSIACGACRRTLHNNSHTNVLRPCGHAICGDCTKLSKESKTCPKCDTPVDAKNGHIELAREGTGFAQAGGSQVVSKATPVFQG